MRELEVIGVRIEMPSNQPLVLLREIEGDRYLPIWIGAVEASAIAFAHQGESTPRPLTHELLQRVIEALDQQLDVVQIDDVADGVFYATLVWAMFDRDRDGTLPRLTQQNLTDADKIVTEELSKIEGLADKAPHERVAPALVATQPHIYAKLAELLAEDVKENAMTVETASTIIKPTEVVIEAFDAAMSGRRPGERQGTVVASAKVGRNEPCPCGSGKKYKQCHGKLV